MHGPLSVKKYIATVICDIHMDTALISVSVCCAAMSRYICSSRKRLFSTSTYRKILVHGGYKLLKIAESISVDDLNCCFS
jgi:hypothetical protein